MSTSAIPFAIPAAVTPPPHPQTPTIRFLRKKGVMLLTGVSSSGIYDLMNRGLFPKSIKLPGGKSVAWLESDILQWMQQTISANSKAA